MKFPVLFERFPQQSIVQTYETRALAFEAAAKFVNEDSSGKSEARVIGPGFVAVITYGSDEVVWVD